MKTYQLLLALAAVLALTTTSAIAVPITVDHQDLPDCDFLNVPKDVDELGQVGIFPTDEQITSGDSLISLIACPSSADPVGTPNQLVAITNLTNKSFDNLWYVADPETRFTNVDGHVNGEEAFKIDEIGLNQPLIGESIAFDGIFEPGEIWRFVVDGYSNNLGIPASAFLSPGQVGGLSGGDSLSSASIIATIVIPEPTSLLLMVFGLAACFMRRK